MAPPIQDLTFTAYQRSTLFERATRAAQEPRLRGNLALVLRDDTGGASITDNAPFTLMGAGDVAALRPGAILHCAPQPFARDAETTKFVHVDFVEPELPWRYTPEANDAAKMKIRPWFVLLVAEASEIQLEGNLVKRVDDAVLKAHDLIAAPSNAKLGEPDFVPAYAWAHVQSAPDQQPHPRLLSPRKLMPQREYVAAIVPAFNDEGAEMWTVNGNDVTRNFGKRGVLGVFYSWRFWTADEGDFATLAAKLHIPKAGNIGKARLHYPRDVVIDGVPEKPVFEVRGAITSLQPDLGRVRPEEMDDDQLLAALQSLMPLPGMVDPALLSTADKQQMLSALSKPVQDRIAETHKDLALLDQQLGVADDVWYRAGDPRRRQFISLPAYGSPWLPEPTMIHSGWPGTLNDDPRFRGLAGLGLWMGVEVQEPLMDAAVQQAGALRDAAQRISYLALGVWAAGRLWDRRLPDDKNARLRIFGPMMGRMPAEGGGSVLSRVTSDSSPFSPALFSTAAQRLLRDRATHTRHTQNANGGVNRSQALDIVNEGEPLPERMPAGVAHMDAVAREMGLPTLEEVLRLDTDVLQKIADILDELVGEVARAYGASGDVQRRHALADRLFVKYFETLQELLIQFHLPCTQLEVAQDMGLVLGLRFGNPEQLRAAFIAFFEDCLERPETRARLAEVLMSTLRHCMVIQTCRELAHGAHIPNPDAFCDDLLSNLPPPPRAEQKPIDLGRLHDALAEALDPRKPDSPARARVRATIKGLDLTRLVPPEFPIGLDFPTWELLRTYDKEWLLPGAGALEKDSIIALQTNPDFIDAYMVGINTQFMSEMRWRDLAVARTCTPLRMFWGQVNYATRKREADIQPLAEWASAPEHDIGDLTHQTIQPADPQNKTGARLVIAFRSDLFRRYPSTLVYLVKPPAGTPDAEVDKLLKDPPELDHTAADRPNRKHFGPTFAATLAPDLTFFAFDVTPATLKEYWLVLDEPPTELRFRNDGPKKKVNSPAFAESTLDQPVRVAISGAELESQGLH